MDHKGNHSIQDLDQGRFLIIRNHRTTIFTEAKEWSAVFRLKCLLKGLKRPPVSSRDCPKTKLSSLGTSILSGTTTCLKLPNYFPSH
uniref:Uncharacterized protein n=1 Tax=Ursus americanus TaxID=9643 RepID=A0A452R538_URSAM